MLTIIAKVNAPVGHAIGVKEDLAMRIISVTEDKPMQLRVGGYETPQEPPRRRRG